MKLYYPIQVLLSVLGILFPVELPAFQDKTELAFSWEMVRLESRVSGHDTELANLKKQIETLQTAIRCPCPRGGICICGADCPCPGCPKHPKTGGTANTGRKALVFGATWCGPCKTAQENRNAAGLIVGVDYTYYDADKEKELADKYGVKSLPCLVRLNPDGTVHSTHLGPDNQVTEIRNWMSAKVSSAGVGLPPDAQPTPWTEIRKGLDLLKPKSSEVLVDFGCGYDARFLTSAAKFYDVKKLVGVEIDKDRADSARQYVSSADLEDRITILDGDATKTDVNASVGMAYLWPETLAELRPKIEKMDRFVSYAHSVPGLRMTKHGNWYLWSKPTAVSQTPSPVNKTVTRAVTRSQPVYYYTSGNYGNYGNSRSYGASWGGRSYSAPVCNSPYCAMCNAIRQQLYYR